MRIRNFLVIHSVVLVLALAGIGIVVVRSLGVQGDLVRSEEQRYRSQLLALELLRSSEDPTRTAPIDEVMRTLDERTRAEWLADEEELRRSTLFALVLAIFAVVGVAASVLFSFRRILRPIDRIKLRVNDIAGGDYAARCEHSTEDEIGDLGERFNAMADSLETDVLIRQRTEETLAKERWRLSNILEGTNVGTWEWNIQTGEAVFNERWAGMLGYTLEELGETAIGTWMEFCHPEDVKKSSELLERHFSGELPYYNFEARMRHKDGSWIWVLDRGKVASWKGGKPWMMAGTHLDITERKLAEERIQHMATHDGLTDLPSLRLARDRLAMALGRARRNETAVAVLYVDLDGFKAVNDAFGHDAGDAVLKEAGKRLCSGVRETDTVARIGGDEYLILLTDLMSREDASRIAEKLIRFLKEPIALNEGSVSVGASIGIALSPVHGTDVEALIKAADEAMYRVKNSGKDNFAFASTEGC